MAGSLLILGMGGYGAVVRECAEAIGGFDKIAFLDDKQSEALGKLSDYEKYKELFTHAYPALGRNTLRLEWLNKLENAGYEIPIFVHPKAYVSPSAKLSKGVCVLANATVCAMVQLSKGVIVNVNAVADHHSVLSECVHLAPSAVVKAECYVEPCAKIESGEIVFRENNI